LRLADFSDSIEAVVFPRLLSANGSVFKDDACIVLKGTLSNRNGELSIISENARVLAENHVLKHEIPKEAGVS